MRFYTIQPTKEWSDFIRYFWVCEGMASEKEPYIHRSLANVYPELLFHYQGVFDEIGPDENVHKSFHTGIHGQTNRYRRFIIKEPFGMFGVQLFPYSLPAFFGMPAIEFLNGQPDISCFLKKDDLHIEERMFTAKDNQERISIITEFLKSKHQNLKRPEIPYIMKNIIKVNGQMDMQDLAKQYFLSSRQFQRIFKENTGFSQKSMARIIRFSSVIESTSMQGMSLTDRAYDFGYYDQSHFIEDFKKFSGYAPGAFFSGKASELSWAG